MTPESVSVQEKVFDVAIIGCGPVGLILATLLAKNGHDVIALERHTQRYSLPRAGHIDHEVMRILQGIGAHRELVDDAPDPAPYDWFGAAGQLILSFPFGEPSVSGYQSDFMIFQPVLDGALYHKLSEYSARALVRMGAEVTKVEQLNDHVELTVQDTHVDDNGRRTAAGQASAVLAKWVVGADGARSFTRGALGISTAGPKIDERWFTLDVTKKKPIGEGIDGQWCDPARPLYVGPLGRNHHRFEMKVLPGEPDEMFDRRFSEEFLHSRGVDSREVEVFRSVIYEFHAQVAKTWRDRRVLLAGDAAHTMPPFMGQGLCSGIRDAANLAWKLDLVLRGVSDERVLDTYELERAPHVQRWTDISLAVGKISAELDPYRARERDIQFAAGTHPPLPTPPTTISGLVIEENQNSDVSIVSGGGLFLQAPAAHQGRTDLFHALVGDSFLIVSLDQDVHTQLESHNSRLWGELDGRFVSLAHSEDGRSVVDTTGAYLRYFDKIGARTVIVRPDYYVFGGCVDAVGLNRLLERLASGLRVVSQAS